jgi:hypothetical protein
VSSILDLCCIQVFYVANVSCFGGMFRESWGHGPDAGRRSTSSEGPTDGSHGAPGVLQTGCVSPRLGSQVLPSQREKGVRRKEWWTQPRCACWARQGRWGTDVHVQHRYNTAAGGRARHQHAWGVWTCSSAPDVQALVSPLCETPPACPIPPLRNSALCRALSAIPPSALPDPRVVLRLHVDRNGTQSCDDQNFLVSS